MNQKELLNRIKLDISAKDSTAEAYLFGSRARGDHRPDSDYDILILVDEDTVTMDIENKFRDDLYELELDSGLVISIFIYPKEYWNNTLVYSPLYANVSREGIQL